MHCVTFAWNFLFYDQELLYHFLLKIKDAMPVSFMSELFTSYILTIFKQWNLLP